MNKYLPSAAIIGIGATFVLRAGEAAPVPTAAPSAQPPAPVAEQVEQSPSPAPKPAIFVDLEKLIGVIAAKLKAADGKLEAADFAAELKEFEPIIARHPDAKIEEKGAVMWAKALLYLQVFEDYDQGAAIVRTFKNDFPNTEFATKADEVLAQIEKERKVSAVSKALVVGGVFPGLEGKGLDGTAVSTAALKGKVVLVDFWATWCGPCKTELPHVVAAYKKYHDKGFDVVAVSLDRDESDLRKFVEEKQIPWPQIFTGASEIADTFGIESIPTTFLVDADGKIAARDLRGDTLEKKLGELLGAK
jgi:thiol-disulfide isomerase/thioredoxin